MQRQNLHTHSLYCDGINSLEEMVLKAIDIDLDSIGFSSHTYTGFSFDDCGIESLEKVNFYKKELLSLKEKYRYRIRIYTGLELESRTASEVTLPSLDYTIGSVHWFWLNGKSFPIDLTPDVFKEAQEYAGGIEKLIENYYEEVIRFATVSDYDITGHIDLVTKFNERANWNFENTSWYKDMAIAALDKLIDRDKLIEVNTGAMSRGYRTEPYPASFILKRAKERNARLILSSDCHCKENLDYYFPESIERIKSFGFKELYFLTDSGFVAESI